MTENERNPAVSLQTTADEETQLGMGKARFKSWQMVRIRGRGPYNGSAWRIAAHVYRERAINCMDAITGLQQDIHTWEDAYDQLQRTTDQLTTDLTAAWANGKRMREDIKSARACLEAVSHFWLRDPLAFGDDATPTSVAAQFAVIAQMCADTLELMGEA